MALQLVGPLNAVPAKALPEDLRAFLAAPAVPASSGDPHQTAGAVYVSMGTAVRLLAEMRNPYLPLQFPDDCQSLRPSCESLVSLCLETTRGAKYRGLYLAAPLGPLPKSRLVKGCKID